MDQNKKPVIYAIGKATQDVFLRSQEFDPKTEGKVMYTHLPLGAKLDIEEAFFSTGGNATNVAVTLARQGLESHFIWALGEDPASQSILSEMKAEQVHTDLVDQRSEYNASFSTVLLSPDGERTILNYRGSVMDEDSFIQAIGKIEQADWLYPSSLGDYRLLDLLVQRAKSLGAKVMFNPASTELEQTDRLKALLKDIEILCLNKDEMQTIVGEGDLEDLVRKGLDYCPVVIVSDGPKGVCASDGKTIVTAGMYEDVPVIDRTGAGDAFASGFLSQWSRGSSLKDAVIFASANSTSVVSKIGAKAGILSANVQLHDMPLEEKMSDYHQNSTGEPRVLAVGDIITDAFIKLSEDHAQSYTDENGYQRLSFELGAKLPYDSVEIVEAVECSPNAAVSMSRLGLNADLMSWLGDDEPGHGMIEYLKGQRVGTDNLVVESGKKTNYHYVLRYVADRTNLQRFVDYSYEWKDPAERPDWLYLGVLGEKTWPLHEGILKYLEANPDIKLAFQPGMYHLMWGAEKLSAFYRRSEIVIMNREEAVTVTGGNYDDVHDLINKLHELGPKTVVVTDGPNGAYASDGQSRLKMPLYPDPAPPVDRTGAGDAFASTFVAALAWGYGIEDALRAAPINSMSVCQKIGAQTGLLKAEELQNYLHHAPEWYKPSGF